MHGEFLGWWEISLAGPVVTPKSREKNQRQPVEGFECLAKDSRSA